MTCEAEFLPAIEIETNSTPKYAIIWLHGLGADGHDFVPIIDQLEIFGVSVRFIFPHAPVRAVTINNGYQMRAWYDITRLDFADREDIQGIRQSRLAIDNLITREMSRGITANHIFLAGFSQGGAMALYAGLRQSHTLAGVIALSCYLPIAETLAFEISDANALIPIFWAYGIHDSVIPIQYAIKTKEVATIAGCHIEWYEYQMDHSVCQQEVVDLGNWLRSRMI